MRTEVQGAQVLKDNVFSRIVQRKTASLVPTSIWMHVLVFVAYVGLRRRGEYRWI